MTDSLIQHGRQDICYVLWPTRTYTILLKVSRSPGKPSRRYIAQMVAVLRRLRTELDDIGSRVRSVDRALGEISVYH